MCINGEISDDKPLERLIKDPYAFGILSREVDFEIELVSSGKQHILLKKRFDGSIGYVLIFSTVVLSLETLRKFYTTYAEYCGRYSRYNFREFELIIITNTVEEDAMVGIKEYNEKYTHRRPIKVIINKSK